jgi:predicted transcriptional regulator
MRWRVVKRVPLNEVRERVIRLEHKYGDRFQQLHEEFVAGRMPRDRFDDYVEWSSMIHAIRAAGEGEDFDYYAEEDLALTPEEFESLTPKRLQLLDYLADEHVSSINELANHIGRDVKNVYGDLQILEHLGFLRLVKEGRSLAPELLVQEVTILLG